MVVCIMPVGNFINLLRKEIMVSFFQWVGGG